MRCSWYFGTQVCVCISVVCWIVFCFSLSAGKIYDFDPSDKGKIAVDYNILTLIIQVATAF